MRPYQTQAKKDCVLLIDHDRHRGERIRSIFPEEYRFFQAESGEAGLDRIREEQEQLCTILLGIDLPGSGSMELLKTLHQQGVPQRIPIFLIDGPGEESFLWEAFRLGVMDLVEEPIHPTLLLHRVRTAQEFFHVRENLRATVQGQQQKLQENAQTIAELYQGAIQALVAAIQFRDVESGGHTNRIYTITKYILSHTQMGEGLSEAEIESIATGSVMHDVGKIAISDAILNKPGKLTSEEFEIMKQHTIKGEELMDQLSKLKSHAAYQYAREIARHHHERWDGSGYPDGLKGDEIKPWTQVVSIADVYDALMNNRVYKSAIPPEQAVEMIRKGECGAFSPKLLECFFQVEPEIRRWYLAGEGLDDGEQARFFSKWQDAAQDQMDKLMTGRTSGSRYVSNALLMLAGLCFAYTLVVFVNLDRDSYYRINQEPTCNRKLGTTGSYAVLLQDTTGAIPPSHRQQFRESFSPENLRRLFDSGQRSLTLEHTHWGEDQAEQWMETRALLLKDASNGELNLLLLSHCVDEKYDKQEQTTKLLTQVLNDILGARERGEKGYIAKPVDLNEMTVMLRHILDAKNQ